MIDKLYQDDIEIIKPIPINLTGYGNNYLTEWEEAGIFYGGESEDEAMKNTTELLAICFFHVANKPDDKLSPKMKTKKTMLNEHMRRKIQL